MTQLTKSENDRVRRIATRVLTARTGEISKVLDLLDDEEEVVRYCAVDRLIFLKTKEAMPKIKELYEGNKLDSTTYSRAVDEIGN